MKIGYKLCCTCDVVMLNTKQVEATKGKIYEIVGVERDSFIIINNSGNKHYFDFDTYETWFSSRIEKLRQIEQHIENERKS